MGSKDQTESRPKGGKEAVKGHSRQRDNIYIHKNDTVDEALAYKNTKLKMIGYLGYVHTHTLSQQCDRA